ncbi:MAG: glutathione binding-like protein, partial [Myxococcota bacterium]
QFFDACHFAGPLGTLTFQHLFRPAPDPDAVEAATKEWRRYAAVAEAALQDSDTLVPGGVTLADVALFASLTYADVNAAPLSDFPNLARWRTMLGARPGFAQTAPPSR